jgi:centrin-3
MLSSSFASPTFPKLTKPPKGRRRELTDEENDEIKEAFELFDNDKDNELDYHEFKV